MLSGQQYKVQIGQKDFKIISHKLLILKGFNTAKEKVSKIFLFYDIFCQSICFLAKRTNTILFIK